MRVTTREELAGTVEEVYALFTDVAFQEAKCLATTDDANHFTVDVMGGPKGERVRTERHLRSDGLPDVAKSFVGATLTVSPNQAPGAYSGSFNVTVNFQ